MTSWPSSASSAAATDESTPPDIATTILATSHRLPREPSQFFDERGQHADDAIDFLDRREQSEAEAQRALDAIRGKPHRAQHVRRLERARGTGRSGRDGDAV